MQSSDLHNDDIFMKQACDLASKSVKIGGGPFGCVITDSEYYVIGKGYNRVTLENDPTQHAEMVAIKDACKTMNTFDLSGCRLYTSCEPCPMCLSAIYWARIKTVFYGNTRTDASNIGFDDSVIYDELNKPIESRSIDMSQIGQIYAKKSFEAWQCYDKKIHY